MRWLPRTLFGQILLAMVTGFVFAQAVGVWLLLAERSRLGDRLAGAYAVQRIAGIVSLLADASPADRARMVRALDVPPTRVTLAQPWREAVDTSDEHARAFAARLAQELGPQVPVQVLSVVRLSRPDGAPPGGLDARERPERWGPSAEGGERRRAHEHGRGGRGLVLVVAQVRLADGAVATFRNAVPLPSVERPLRVLAWVGGTWLVVGLLVAWAVRRVTRPLAGLAQAAAGLGRNLDQPPVPETGPAEVARVAAAFNAMQRDLKSTLAARSQALAGVSHDLRLPLTRMRLRLESSGDQSLRQAIERDLADMDTMIGATLEYLRAGENVEPLTQVKLDALIDDLAEDMEALGAQVTVHARAGQPVLARPHALRRCLANLLDNARVHGGGRIDIGVERDADRLRIRVEDRGPGIPLEARERVFQPYFRLDPSRARHTGGSGLGLAIARAFARAHGGDVTLDARPGGGLSAVLTLPV